MANTTTDARTTQKGTRRLVSGEVGSGCEEMEPDICSRGAAVSAAQRSGQHSHCTPLHIIKRQCAGNVSGSGTVLLLKGTTWAPQQLQGTTVLLCTVRAYPSTQACSPKLVLLHAVVWYHLVFETWFTMYAIPGLPFMHRNEPTSPKACREPYIGPTSVIDPETLKELNPNLEHNNDNVLHLGESCHTRLAPAAQNSRAQAFRSLRGL